jgi:hypothetical protein
VVFAATVPSRKPTPKDLADAKERPDDAIEPKDHATMGDMVSFSIGQHSIVSK